MAEHNWSAEAPSEPGRYWFFGEPYMGGMGGHHKGTVKPDLELHHVVVHQIGNGLSFVCDGHLVSSHKWDGMKEGWLGLWLDCRAPNTDNLASIIERTM